jgi:predicted MFS family arabinose efflux permease
MEGLETPPQTLRETAAALLVGSVALLILGLQPILLGELADRRVITMEGLGIVAMGEIVALGLGAALGNALLPTSRYRLIAIAAALAAALFDAASCLAGGDAEIAALRAAAGLAEGVLVWVTTAVIVRSRKPDRLAAVFMVVGVVTQAAAAALLAGVVVPRGGWQAGFAVMGAVSLLSVVLVPWLPIRLKPLAETAAEKLAWNPAALLPLAVAFMQMAAIGSLWAYLEPLGLKAGLDAQSAQGAVSVVLVAQFAGGLSAVYLVRRFGTVSTLGLGAIVLGMVAGGMAVLSSGAAEKFDLLCAALGFTWLFLMPFHVALAFRADASGRIASFVPAAQLLGSAFGPLLASVVISGEEAGPVPLVSLGCAALALVTVLACTPSPRQARAHAD